MGMGAGGCEGGNASPQPPRGDLRFPDLVLPQKWERRGLAISILCREQQPLEEGVEERS